MSHRALRTLARLVPLLVLIISPGCSRLTGGNPTTTPTQPLAALPPTPTSAPPTPAAPLPPALVESEPPPGAELGAQSPITLYFNQPMDRASVEAALSSQPEVAAAINWIDDTTVRYMPEQSLPPGTQISLQIDADARSSAGLLLGRDVDLQYQTAGPLRLVQALPEPDTADVDPTSAVVAAFNRPVVPLGADPASLPAAFQLEPQASGRGEWLNTSTYTFYPDPALEGGRTYTVHLDPGLTSTGGSRLESAESWTFDTATPRLLDVLPEPGSQSVRLDAQIVLEFNQPMDPQSVADNFSLISAAAGEVAGSWEWNEDYSQGTFQPDNLLLHGTRYNLILLGETQARGGTPLDQALNTTLMTVPPLAITRAGLLPNNSPSPQSTVQVAFNGPIDTRNILESIQFVPSVSGLDYWWEEDTFQLNLYGRFQPDSGYVLILDGNLPDPWGGTLGQAYTTTIRTGPLPPGLTIVAPSDALFLTPQDAGITAQATNLGSVTISRGSLSLEDFFALLRPDGYELRQNYQPAGAVSWTQNLELPPNRSQPVTLYLSPDRQPLQAGLYFLRLNAPQQTYQPGPYLLVISPIQLTFKISATDALVWAVDLRTNMPLAGETVTVYDENGQTLAQGETAEDGIFQAEIGPLEETYGEFFAVAGSPGQANFSLARSSWSEGLAGWNFSLPTDGGQPRDKIYLYSDRPIYRPGQTIYFRAVVRRAYNGRYELPDMASLPLELYDPRGEQVASFDLPLSPYGSAAGEFTLPEDAPTGYYNLHSPLTFYDSLNIQVAAYRKPEIDLQVEIDPDQVLTGQLLQAQIQARYFFDAPAGNLPVQWTLYANPDPFYLPGYQTGPLDTGWLEPFQMPFFGGFFGQQIDQGEGETGPDGSLQIEIPAELPESLPAGRRLRYTLEVTARDESGLPVSGRAEALANPAEFYIGIRPEVWVARAGEAAGFEVQMAGWEGDPAGSSSLVAEFHKVEWIRRDSPEPMEPPTFEAEYTLIGSTDFTTSESGRARLAFTPPDPGTYQLNVYGDGALTEVLVWVSGPGEAVWPNIPRKQIRLIQDSESYKPGQTAQIFVPNPFEENALALLTVERAKVMRYEVVTLAAGGATLPIELGEEDAPNVYVSLTLLDPNAPDFRQGYINLPVEPERQTLEVQVSVQPSQAGPGDQVTLEILVQDASGSPVEGEFSLAIVDQAVLALADPNAPGIVTAFYGQQPLGVRSSASLSGYANLSIYIPPGMGGGGGDESTTGLEVRENLPDTAYWEAQIVTGPDGRAQVSLPLPDNLTTWQVDVRGLTADSRVGQAETEIVVSRPLLVRPVTPRFLVAGDHTVLAAVVHNNTQGQLDAAVSLQAGGVNLDDPAAQTQRITLPPGGRERVEWWVTVQSVEAVEAVFSAQAGDLQDAARPAFGDLPVLQYTARQTFATAGVLEGNPDDSQALELISLPRSFQITNGELQVELSPSLAAAMLKSLDALEHFPYECIEQTLSRFLPNLEAYRALQEFGVSAPALEDRLARTLDEGLFRLEVRQNEDGGWGWWKGDQSDPTVSAYVLFGLSRAQEAGVSVDENMFQRAIEYLEAVRPTAQMLSEPWQFNRQAFLLFALSEAGAGDAGATQSLAQEAERLDAWAQALLALTLERTGGADGTAGSLLSNLQSTAVRSATGAHWELESQPGSAQRNMITPLSNSAIVLYALAQNDPGSPLVGDATRYLMAHRQVDGGWNSTYASAWSLMALTEVMRGTGELGGAFNFSALLNGAPVASGQAGGPAEQLIPVQADVSLPGLRQEAPNELLIERDPGNGRLYYTAALQVSRPVEAVAPLSQGIFIERTYFPAGEDCQAEDCQPVQEARAGDLVTVRLALTLPNDVYYLMVEDFLPAGAEVLDTSLKTSQQGATEAPGPQFDPRRPFANGWGWWLFNQPQIYDERIAWSADYLPAGSYELTYTLVMLQPGEFRVLPARSWQFYFPEVQGNSAGEVFLILP